MEKLRGGSSMGALLLDGGVVATDVKRFVCQMPFSRLTVSRIQATL
jgi:hypothetical protein